jgi:RNA polymerase sigma-70 factor, ECF subfamily
MVRFEMAYRTGDAMSEFVAEKDLVAAAIDGDAVALERLLFANFSELERYVGPKIPDDVRQLVGTEDVLQEVLTQAFRDIRQFEHRTEGGFLAWLKTIADHRVTDALKRVRRKKRGGNRHRVTAADVVNTSTMATLFDLICADSHLPDKSAARREAECALQVALAGLPEDQRDAIHANFLQGKDVEQIAIDMGRTPDAIRGLIHRGKKNLADAMGRSSRWLSSH